MSLNKRGSTWWVSFTTPAGQRIRRSAGTSDRQQAQELLVKLKAESWRVEKLGEKPKYTWDDAGHKWLLETSHKRTHREDAKKLVWLQQFLRGRVLSEIGREDIAKIGEKKRLESSGPTANRYLALIRAILRKACLEWEWIDKAPKVRLYKEAKRRVRWITPEQVNHLLQELPFHQRDIVLFALATGLRQANVLGLTWNHVDLARQTAWIPGDQAKGKEDIHISLSQFAVEILQRQLGKNGERVFTYAGKPVGQVNTKAWRGALQRAGIEDFRWHDLRHTWASWLVQNGTPMYDLQEMGGWKSTEMVRRYAHLAPAQMAKHAAVVGNLLCGTNTAQGQK
jgi:integrase